jgi:PleD family two-component response regulator
MRIALVDPSRTTRLIVTRLLEARGHNVLPFADEREALEQIRADLRIDAMITSAELSHMSGLELCWETRLLATYKRPIYVLMMSSQYDQRNLVEALDSGADDFIGKPPLAEELYARLRAAERIASMQRELIRLATIDPLTGLCNRRGFFEQATELRARTIPHGNLSAILLDIDNFKYINDSYGHEAGDEAIRACARAAAAGGHRRRTARGRRVRAPARAAHAARGDPDCRGSPAAPRLATLRHRQGPDHAYLERRCRRGGAGRHGRPASRACRCGAL